MRSESVLAAALVAATAVAGAGAAPGRPKIYFPRNVRRQFFNFTITSTEAPSDTPSDTPSADLTALGPTAPKTTDLLSDLLGLTADLTNLLPTKPGTKSNKSPTVTTIIIPSTITIPDLLPTASSAIGDPASAETSTSDSTATSTTLAIGAGAGTRTRRPTVTVDPSGTNVTTADVSTTATTPDATTPPVVTSSSDAVIVIAPTGIIGSLTSLVGSVVSDVTSLVPSILPTPNITDIIPPLTSAIVPPLTSAVATLLPTGTVTIVPTDLLTSLLPTVVPTSVVVPPPITNVTDVTVPPTSVVTVPPPDTTAVNVTSQLPPTDLPVTSIPPTTVITPIVLPPTTIPTGVPITANITSINGTSPETVLPPPDTTTSAADTASGVTSISAISTVTNNQPWLPTTIIVDPTPTTTLDGLAPTSATALPTQWPKGITPDSANTPAPEDTTDIQIAFYAGFNYPFVVSNNKAAAQIFKLLPQALTYAGGISSDKVQMRKLVPLNTLQSLGYVTTVAIVTYPTKLVETLRMDVKIPTSPVYSNPEELIYNLTAQINSGIDIILGSYPDTGKSATGTGDAAATSTSVPNGDPYNTGNNEDTGAATQTAGQRGATAGIAFGVVGVAAAYGAAMFVIARRYKRKKQAHRRTSSVSEPSEMRMTTSPNSPPMMGGALLSREFSSYGGVAGGRDSHGSGRSGGNTSGRTAYISAPVAQENSLGWN